MRFKTSYAAAIAAAVSAVVFSAAFQPANATPIDINGGSSWGGWSLRGNSLDVGIWGSGDTTRSYDIYTTIFTATNIAFDSSTGGTQVRNAGSPIGFGNNSRTTGSFLNGNQILGVGLKFNGSASSVSQTFLHFGIGSNNFLPATSLGAADGRTSFNAWANNGDFGMWMDGVSTNGPSQFDAYSSGTSQGGPGAQSNITGNNTNYSFAYRMFRNGTGAGSSSLQFFLDLTNMQNIYSASNPLGLTWTAGGYRMGTIGNQPLNMSLGNYNSTFTSGNYTVVAVPEPTHMVFVAGVGAALGAWRLRKLRRNRGESEAATV